MTEEEAEFAVVDALVELMRIKQGRRGFERINKVEAHYDSSRSYFSLIYSPVEQGEVERIGWAPEVKQ